MIDKKIFLDNRSHKECKYAFKRIYKIQLIYEKSKKLEAQYRCFDIFPDNGKISKNHLKISFDFQKHLHIFKNYEN
jgi:hypothetical protein